MSKTVYLDTNICLHYQMIDQFDWPRVLDTDVVTIVVPPITLRELKKHKDQHPRERVRRRAGLVIQRLTKLAAEGPEAELRNRVSLRIEDREPRTDFQAHQLDPAEQDDQLIASIIVHQTENPASECVLVTDDGGLLLTSKAGRQSIESFTLPDEFKLPHEPDPERKRIQELEDELRQLKLQIPRLTLTFEEHSQHITVEISPPVVLSDERLAAERESIESQYPPLMTGSPQIKTAIESLSALGAPTASDVRAYNDKLAVFYDRRVNYLVEAARYQSMIRRTIELSILVANEGSAPADDVDVFLHFPNGMRVIDADGYPRRRNPPSPPSKPQSRMDSITRAARWMAREAVNDVPVFPSILESLEPQPNVSAPTIVRTDGYEVSYHIQRVKHYLPVTIGPLYMILASYDDAKPFHIDYRIGASNAREEATGKLHIVVEKQDPG